MQYAGMPEPIDGQQMWCMQGEDGSRKTGNTVARERTTMAQFGQMEREGWTQAATATK